MDEIIKSIKSFLYDRTVSPLFGAFIAGWALCNYRIILTLLDGKASLSEKMAFLDDHFGPITLYAFGTSLDIAGVVIYNFFGPAFFAWLYLYVYPLFAKPVYEHSLAKQVELRNIKREEESARLLSLEESRYLIKEIEQLRYKSDEDAKKYTERITSLTETINAMELQQQNETKKEEKKTGTSNKIEDEEKEGNLSQINSIKQEERDKFIKALRNRMPVTARHDEAFEMLLEKVAAYCLRENITPDMLLVLMLLVNYRGSLHKSELLKHLDSQEINSVEGNYLLSGLMKSKLINVEVYNNNMVVLTNEGNAMAVDSGLTALLKLVERNSV